MEREILVKVEGVSKKFCRNLKRSLFYGVQDIAYELFGIKKNNGLRKNEFWAVDNLSFELVRGECLGLIGHNGAGKSTLLKMLNGLIKPDKGKITIKGRVGALIELGAGFNPILTGRENIYNNGAVLGFSKKEIDNKFEAIVEFAEIEEFIDTPIQNYSSGMKVRLGFAVAAQMEPDVLIIDEVLAVGDVGFRIKSYNTITELSKNCCVIFVSHSMPQIARVSNHLMMLNKGQNVYYGVNIAKGIEKYFSSFSYGKQTVFGTNVLIKGLSINDGSNTLNTQENIKYLSDLRIRLNFETKEIYDDVKVEFVFFDMDLKPIASTSLEKIQISNPKSELEILLPKIQFAPGIYSININFFKIESDSNKERTSIISKYENIKKIKVYGSDIVNHVSFQLMCKWKINNYA